MIMVLNNSYVYRSVRAGFLASGTRFRLSETQPEDTTISSNTWSSGSWFWFPHVNNRQINNVIVNETNSGVADFEINSNIQFVSDNTYRLSSTTDVENNVDIGDSVTYNFVDNNLNYSRQGSVTGLDITNNTIDVNLDNFSIGQLGIIIAGFDEDTHEHLNGEYLPTTTIPTFTGFDPDGDENSIVDGSVVYSRTNEIGRTFYIWNRFDSDSTQGGWHVSSSTAGDNSNIMNPLNWARLDIDNPQNVSPINIGNWVEISGTDNTTTFYC